MTIDWNSLYHPEGGFTVGYQPNLNVKKPESGLGTDNNNNNTWGNFASILQGIGSIGSGIQAYKSIPLMRRQLNEATALNRANFSQQANLINQQALQQHRQHLTSSGLDEEEFRKRYGGPVNLQTTY